MKCTIICASNCERTLQSNLLQSPYIHNHQLIIKRGYKCVARAYNEAIKEAKNDIMVFVHQDVYLPWKFFLSLSISIQELGMINWGIIGPAGRNLLGEYYGHILDRGKLWGSPENLPAPVQTLDELLLVGKKSGAFKRLAFDEQIPNHHLFGSDICLQAKDAGFENYAINTFLHHNSTLGSDLPENWKDSARYIKEKWTSVLPIYSTCEIIG
jgi:hypothetical protein